MQLDLSADRSSLSSSRPSSWRKSRGLNLGPNDRVDLSTGNHALTGVLRSRKAIVVPAGKKPTSSLLLWPSQGLPPVGSLPEPMRNRQTRSRRWITPGHALNRYELYPLLAGSIAGSMFRERRKSPRCISPAINPGYCSGTSPFSSWIHHCRSIPAHPTPAFARRDGSVPPDFVWLAHQRQRIHCVRHFARRWPIAAGAPGDRRSSSRAGVQSARPPHGGAGGYGVPAPPHSAASRPPPISGSPNHRGRPVHRWSIDSARCVSTPSQSLSVTVDCIGAMRTNRLRRATASHQRGWPLPHRDPPHYTQRHPHHRRRGNEPLQPAGPDPRGQGKRYPT